LFEGVFDHAGEIRKYNITKKEYCAARNMLLTLRPT
jgi:fido (protein-threonine AMPylation protein)